MNTVEFVLDRIESSRLHRRVYRLHANGPIPKFGVSTGDIGGLVEHQDNICDSWVEDGAFVFDSAKLYNCRLRAGSCITNDAIVNGNGYFLGGSMGPVTLGGKTKLTLTDNIDMGPITIFDDVELTEHDILSINGIFKCKGWATHLTFYKKSNRIKCYSCSLEAGDRIYIEELGLYLEQCGVNNPRVLAKHLIGLARTVLQ